MDLLDHTFNPDTGEHEAIYYDPLTDKTYIRQFVDAEPLIDRATEMRNTSFGFASDHEVRPVADIPTTLVYQWMKEGFDIFTATKEELRRKLADYPKLMTAPKRTNPGIIITGSR